MPTEYGEHLPNLANFLFTWAASGISYLGISITLNVTSSLSLNLQRIHKNIKNDLTNWKDLPISWMGRTNLLKINVIPWLLYPIQMLPIYISKKTAKEIENDFSKIIWQEEKQSVWNPYSYLKIKKAKHFPILGIIIGPVMEDSFTNGSTVIWKEERTCWNHGDVPQVDY